MIQLFLLQAVVSVTDARSLKQQAPPPVSFHLRRSGLSNPAPIEILQDLSFAGRATQRRRRRSGSTQPNGIKNFDGHKKAESLAKDSSRLGVSSLSAFLLSVQVTAQQLKKALSDINVWAKVRACWNGQTALHCSAYSYFHNFHLISACALRWHCLIVRGKFMTSILSSSFGQWHLNVILLHRFLTSQEVWPPIQTSTRQSKTCKALQQLLCRLQTTLQHHNGHR